MDRRVFLSSAGAGVAGLGVMGWDIRRDRRVATTEAGRRAFGADPSGVGRLGHCEVVWSVESAPHHVGLTFDDGPDPRYTPPILEALAAAGVSATFNMMGHNVIAHPDLARAVIEAGHQVGNHGATHVDLAQADPETTRREIEDGLTAIEELGVERVRWYRPPRGDLTGAALRAATTLNHDVLMWSVDGHPRHDETPAELADSLASSIRGGDIVCLHDGLGRGTFHPDAEFTALLRRRRDTEVAALPALLAFLADAGVQPVTASELVSVGAT